MIKKALKISYLCVFLFLFCSSCTKKVEKCQFLPNLSDFDSKNLKNYKDFLESGQMYAQVNCNF